MIRIPQVRVVDENGSQLGVMPTPQALGMAQERGLDLVEVAPMAAPPVVRFLDFGQYKYELAKREKEAKRKQRAVTFKEVRLRPKIGTGDFTTKVHRAVEFLEDGDRIKVAVQFRGREMTHPEIGRALLERFSEAIKEHGTVERAPTLEGRSMHITVASTHKPRPHDAGTKPRAEGPATSPPGDATAAAGEADATTEEPSGTSSATATSATAAGDVRRTPTGANAAASESDPTSAEPSAGEAAEGMPAANSNKGPSPNGTARGQSSASASSATASNRTTTNSEQRTVRPAAASGE